MCFNNKLHLITLLFSFFSLFCECCIFFNVGMQSSKFWSPQAFPMCSDPTLSLSVHTAIWEEQLWISKHIPDIHVNFFIHMFFTGQYRTIIYTENHTYIFVFIHLGWICLFCKISIMFSHYLANPRFSFQSLETQLDTMHNGQFTWPLI